MLKSEKKARSSNRETPKPESKSQKMWGHDDLGNKIRTVIDSIAELNKYGRETKSIDLEIGQQQARLDELSSTIDSIVQRLSSIENKLTNSTQTSIPITSVHPGMSDPLSNPDVTVIASNLSFGPSESILSEAKALISELGDGHDGETSLLRVSKTTLRSFSEKKRVLRDKHNLKSTEENKNVYIRSSKTHVERLVELNVRTLLNEMPNGNQY
ncbi:LOW QUALITY PROTEIN: hypothetical protein KUTeg_005169, partial [Tegillarca granosa]